MRMELDSVCALLSLVSELLVSTGYNINVSHSVVSDSLQTCGLGPAGLFPGENTALGCHFLLLIV